MCRARWFQTCFCFFAQTLLTVIRSCVLFCTPVCFCCKSKQCGVDGFQCKDPSSALCDNIYNPECAAPETKPPKPTPICGPDAKLYTITEYDSWGDGWDNTQLIIKSNDGKEIFTGSLEDGFEGSEAVCLGKGCFTASAQGGMWGVEVSWEIRPFVGGAVLASGGSPMECTFAIEGNYCENTCTGKPADPGEKEMTECMGSKCLLQLGACNSDDNCSPCLINDSPGYCYTNNAYNDLVDCAICQCTDDALDYCSDMMPSMPNKNTCNAQQTLQGSSAVLTYAKCADVDSVAAMITDWNVDSFGSLDDFEWCSHMFNDSPGHNGKRALDCMNILNDIVSGESRDADYVKNLATHIYKKPQETCDCAVEANKNTPACDSFERFKTLLYETLDACKALDEIDCAAWEEFTKPCKANLQEEFGSVDFSNQAQCKLTCCMDSC